MDEQSAAWQTYHGKACEHLSVVEVAEHIGTDTRAQMAVGWALLALVEVLKPQDAVVERVPRGDAPWGAVHAALAEYQRLVPLINKRVEYQSNDLSGDNGVLVYVGLPELADLLLHDIGTVVTMVTVDRHDSPLAFPSQCIIGPAS